MPADMEWALEIVLIGLLAATLFHALRLERALGVLKRDRAALEALVSAFNSSTVSAEQGIERLRGAADGAGRQLSRHIDLASGLKDDLVLLSERGDRLADRLEASVRSGRGFPKHEPDEALMPARPPASRALAFSTGSSPDEDTQDINPRLRSQAERDLLKALRMGR